MGELAFTPDTPDQYTGHAVIKVTGMLARLIRHEVRLKTVANGFMGVPCGGADRLFGNGGTGSK